MAAFSSENKGKIPLVFGRIYCLVAVKFLEHYFYKASNKGKVSLLVVVSECREGIGLLLKGSHD